MRTLSRRNSRSMLSSRWSSVNSRTRASRPPLLRYERLRSRIMGVRKERLAMKRVFQTFLWNTAEKRRCLGSADVLNVVVVRESNNSPRRSRYASKLCLLNGRNRQKLWKKELLRFFVCSRRRLNVTLCFWDRKGNSLDEGWCWSRKRNARRTF